MNLVLVTYDIRRGVREDYKSLFAELRKTSWWHFLQSTWILSTYESPQEVFERIAPHIDQKDRCFVTLIGGSNPAGNLPSEADRWLNEQFKRNVALPAAVAPTCTYADIATSIKDEIEWKQNPRVRKRDRHALAARAYDFVDKFRAHISGGSRVTLNEQFVEHDPMFIALPEGEGIGVNSEGVISFSVRVELDVNAKGGVDVGIRSSAERTLPPPQYDPEWHRSEWTRLTYCAADDPRHLFVTVVIASSSAYMSPDHVMYNSDRLAVFFNKLAERIRYEARAQVWKTAAAAPTTQGEPQGN